MRLFNLKKTPEARGPFQSSAISSQIASVVYARCRVLSSESLQEKDAEKANLASSLSRVAGYIAVGAIEIPQDGDSYDVVNAIELGIEQHNFRYPSEDIKITNVTKTAEEVARTVFSPAPL